MLGRATSSGLLAIVLAFACKGEPPPASDTVARIAEMLLAPKPRGPAVIVEVAWAGHGTLEVEHDVAMPIESAIASAVETNEIETIASPGLARIQVTAPSGADPFELTQALREAMPLRMLPPDVEPPVLTRADREGRVLFAMIETMVDALSEDDKALDRLADEVARQPGVWNVRRCGQGQPTMSIDIDPRRLAAFGIGLDQMIEFLQTQAPTGDNDISGMNAAFGTSIGVTLRLTDVASIAVGERQGPCVVLGIMGRQPTLEIWASEQGLDAATKALRADALAPRLRMWTVGDPRTPTGIVASTVEAQHQNRIMTMWLMEDRALPAWLVRNGDDPAWLLASEGTQLRSFSRAAAADLHVWWPGAPLPVSARICGPELDVLVTTADALGDAMRHDELLDDVAVWAPRSRPRRVFAIDRARAAERGVATSMAAQLGTLASGEEVTLATRVPIVVRTDPTAANELAVRTSTGLATLAELGTSRDVSEPEYVQRFNRERCATVDLQPRRDEDREKIEALVRERALLPIGVTLTFAAL